MICTSKPRISLEVNLLLPCALQVDLGVMPIKEVVMLLNQTSLLVGYLGKHAAWKLQPYDYCGVCFHALGL
jgi:hypothetical protein